MICGAKRVEEGTRTLDTWIDRPGGESRNPQDNKELRVATSAVAPLELPTPPESSFGADLPTKLEDLAGERERTAGGYSGRDSGDGSVDAQTMTRVLSSPLLASIELKNVRLYRRESTLSNASYPEPACDRG